MVSIPPPRKRRRWIKWAVLAALVLGGLLWWRPWQPAPLPIQALRTVPVTSGDVEDVVSALGSLEALRYVDVGAQVTGQLQKIHVEVGGTVKKGDLVAEVDPTLYLARVGADQAQLNALHAQVAEKEAQRVLAEQQFKRQQILINARATSQDLYDSAVATFKAVQAQLDALNAQIEQVEANLKADQANLGYTKIYAPMDGTVVDISAREGQTIIAAQIVPTILRIADLGTMTVKAQVSEADVSRLKIGMPAYFSTLGQPDQRREGTLRQILPTPTVTNNVVLYNVLFDVPNADGALLPQMSAQVFFVAASARNVVMAPMEALIPGPGGQFVALVLKDGKPQPRPVQLGIANRVTAEIKSGLQPGELLLLPPPGFGGPPGAPPGRAQGS